MILKDLHPTNCWMKPTAYCLSVWISSKTRCFLFSGWCDVFSSVEREPWITPFLRIIITTFSDQCLTEVSTNPAKVSQQTVYGWIYPGGGVRFLSINSMVNLLLLVGVAGSEFNILQYIQLILNIPDANLANFYEFFPDFRNPFQQFFGAVHHCVKPRHFHLFISYNCKVLASCKKGRNNQLPTYFRYLKFDDVCFFSFLDPVPKNGSHTRVSFGAVGGGKLKLPSQQPA